MSFVRCELYRLHEPSPPPKRWGAQIFCHRLTSQGQTQSKIEQSSRVICHPKEMPRKVPVSHLWDAFSKEKVTDSWHLKRLQRNRLLNYVHFSVSFSKFCPFFNFSITFHSKVFSPLWHIQFNRASLWLTLHFLHTHCRLSARYDLNHLSLHADSPICSSFLKSILCLIESNALDISRNSISVTFPPSMQGQNCGPGLMQCYENA